jgi:transposase
MVRSLHPDVIAPPGLLVDRVELADRITIIAQPAAASARCPGCDQPSSRVHSRYTRTLADLPVAGRQAVIEVGVRRFR